MPPRTPTHRSTDAAPPEGRRAQNRRTTREALVTAALRLFGERGFDAVTVDEIAVAAGVSRRTFFRYFPSKEAAFFAPQEARLAAFEGVLAVQLARTGDAGEAVREALLGMARTYMAERAAVLAAHRVLHAARGLAAWDQQLDSRWEQVIAGAMAPTLGETQAVVYAGALVGTVRAGLRRWFDAEGAFDLEDFGRQAFAWLHRGFDLPAPPLPPAF